MAHLIISDLAATETLDRKALVSVKGGRMSDLAKPGSRKALVPYFPVFWGSQHQNVAVSAAQVAHNFGYGAINQNLAINVNATQA